MNGTAVKDLMESVNLALEDTSYSFSSSGLWLNTNSGPRRLSNFVVIPQEFVTKDSGKPKKEVYVKVYGCSNIEELPETTLTLEEFDRMTWPSSEWGFSIITEVQSNVTNHIRRVAQALGNVFAQDTTVYTHMGWRHIGDSWCYLHSGGVIGDEAAQVELDQNVTCYTLPDHAENYQEAVRASLRLKDVAPAEISVPLLALVYLSPLNEFFRQAGHEPAFVTSLTGPTGTMKSTLAALALCHFGQFTGKSLLGSFQDTKNALEVTGFALKDTLMVVDDFFPSTQRHESTIMSATLRALLRSYGDRSGRRRLSSNLKLMEAHIPRGNLLVTGEDVPKLVESDLARLLLLEINPGDVDKELLSSLQKDSSLLGQAMRGYIEWLIPQANTLKDMLLEKFEDYRQQAQEHGRHSRIPEVIAWLKIGYEMFLDYAVSCDVIPSDSKQIVLDEALEILTEIANRQAMVMENDTPVSQFLSALNEMLATGQCHCTKLDDDGSFLGSTGSIKGHGFIGYVDSDYYYLIPGTTMGEVKAFYGRQGINFTISDRMLYKQLASVGAIRESKTGKRVNRTLDKHIDGTVQRLLWVKKEALKKLNGPDET